MGKSSTKAKNKYNKTAYRQVCLQIKPDIMDLLNIHCKNFSYTRNSFITQAIKEKIERDTGKSFDEFFKEPEDQKELLTSGQDTKAPKKEPMNRKYSRLTD